MKKIYILMVIVLIAIFCFKKQLINIFDNTSLKIKNGFTKETVQSVVSKIEKSCLERIQKDLKKNGFETYPEQLTFVGLKKEQVLEVYGMKNHQYKLIKKYPFTAFSGHIGPKLKEGDRQIPEGIYEIDYLNPNSSFYLSIKINYPNKFDKSKSKFDDHKKMGGDIFIHGRDLTIGCIPLGDEAIEEVFLLASKAKKEKIKVIIAPHDFRKNPTLPSIENIDWEEELYTKIKNQLIKIK